MDVGQGECSPLGHRDAGDQTVMAYHLHEGHMMDAHGPGMSSPGLTHDQLQQSASSTMTMPTCSLLTGLLSLLSLTLPWLPYWMHWKAEERIQETGLPTHYWEVLWNQGIWSWLCCCKSLTISPGLSLDPLPATGFSCHESEYHVLKKKKINTLNHFIEGKDLLTQ